MASEAAPQLAGKSRTGRAKSAGMGPTVVVRRARPADARRLGEIHVLAWQAAYVGVMPDDYLAGLSVDDRAQMWERSIGAPRPGQVVLVVADDGGVQGFAVFGPEENDPEEVEVAEIQGINVDPAAWGRGLGRRLLRRCTEVLLSQGYRQAVLWVVPANSRARGLYESENWRADGAEREDELLGVRVRDMRYRLELTA